MSLTITTTLRASFADAVAKTRKALAEQGFGVLTEIDVEATMKSKLDADMGDYLILGACNPTLAYRALGVDPRLGVLLPCNVVVRSDPETEDSVVVDAMEPQMMVQVADQPGLRAVAEEASVRLRAAVDALARAAEMGDTR